MVKRRHESACGEIVEHLSRQRFASIVVHHGFNLHAGPIPAPLHAANILDHGCAVNVLRVRRTDSFHFKTPQRYWAVPILQKLKSMRSLQQRGTAILPRVGRHGPLRRPEVNDNDGHNRSYSDDEKFSSILHMAQIGTVWCSALTPVTLTRIGSCKEERKRGSRNWRGAPSSAMYEKRPPIGTP